MKKVVCIKSGQWVPVEIGEIIDNHHPQTGGIYTVENLIFTNGKEYYLLKEFEALYEAIAFREVDNTFGHVVTETIEQQLQLETAW